MTLETQSCQASNKSVLILILDCFLKHILEVYTDFCSSSVFIALFGLKCHLWQRRYKTIARNLMLKQGMLLKRYRIWDSGASLQKIPHVKLLSIFPSQEGQEKCSTDYSGSSHHRCSSTSLRWEWAWRSRDEKFKKGVKKRLSQRKTETSDRLKKSCTEHHLVSNTVVHNTIKIMFLLSEKTSYLSIVTDAWCNDWQKHLHYRQNQKALWKDCRSKSCSAKVSLEKLS